jgi:hypothetical protein
MKHRVGRVIRRQESDALNRTCVGGTQGLLLLHSRTRLCLRKIKTPPRIST